MPAPPVVAALMLPELLLGSPGFVAAFREGGVNENTLSPPFPAARALGGPACPSADGSASRISRGGGRRDSRPCPGLSLDIGQSTGGGSGNENIGVFGTSPSSLSQGKAEEGGGGTWLGVSGGSSCEPAV